MLVNIKIDNSIKCNADVSAFISFEYDVEILKIIQSLPDRYWNAKDKVWETPIKYITKLVNSLPNCTFNIEGNYTTIEKKKVNIPSNFSFKTTPYTHQAEGFEYGLNNNKWLLADEQGLGKTKQVIDIAVAKKLNNGYKHCLIICGVNSLKWNWAKEVEIHSNETAHILGQRIKNGKTYIGSSLDKLTDLELVNDNSPYFLITNIESLRYKVETGNMIKKKGRLVKEYKYPITDKLVELCENGTIEMIAFDEFHKCKNYESEQGSQILRMHADTMIGMTGTPLMNTPMDLYVVLKWLGYERHSYYSFENHYCVKGGFGGYQIIGYRNLDQLQEQLNEFMLRRTKKEVLDLPEKIYVDELVEMDAKQKAIYDECFAEVQENIDQIASSPNPLSQLIRLRQATGYTGILSSKVKLSSKLDRMEELVEEAIDNGQQVVVFSNWTQITDIVKTRLNKNYSVGVITGQTKDNDRQDIVDAFQSGEYKVLVGTIGAMGTGLTLTAGTVEIFLDEPWTMASKLQAEDRCHRVGTTSKITVYTLMCKNTIDERIHEIVKEKGEMADVMIDGKKPTNIELLNFLIS